MKTSRIGRVTVWDRLGTLLLFLGAVLWLIPLVWTVLISVRPPGETIVTGNIFFGSRITLENFEETFRIVDWRVGYGATLIFVFGVLAAQLVTITLAGFAFARLKFFGKRVLFTLILVQIMIPSAVLLVPNFSTIRALGLYDNRLGLMLPYFGSAFGTFLMRQAFRQVPLDLEDAARLDGCSWIGLLRHVYLPASIPTLVAFSLISITARWNEFLWPLMVTRSDENRPLAVLLAQVQRTNEVGALYGQTMAGVLIVIATLLILFIFFQRQFINSFVRSGLR